MQKNASISREDRSTGDTQTARLLQALQHKQKRIMCRQCIRECICTGILDLVMESPEQVVLDNYGGTVHQSRFVADNGKTYLLRAFINDEVEPAIVKSIYVTSKIRKYWREEQ